MALLLITYVLNYWLSIVAINGKRCVTRLPFKSKQVSKVIIDAVT